MESLLVLHAVAAVCAPWLVRRTSLAVLALPPGIAFLAVLLWLPPRERVEWAPVLGLELSFRADALGVLMMSLVTGVGALVMIYSSRYFSRDDPGLGRYGCFMTGFAGSMLGLVAADDLLLLYVFWELTTAFSYLLIGYDPRAG